MNEETITSGEDIEVRGDISPEQRNICEQLSNIIQKLEGVKVQAIGMEKTWSPVVGKEDHAFGSR